METQFVRMRILAFLATFHVGHTCCLTHKQRCSQVQVHGRGGGPLLPLVALAGPCIPGLGRGQRGQDLPPQEQVWDHWVLRGCNFTHFTFDRSLTPLHLWMPTYICQCLCNIKTNLQCILTEIPRTRKLIGFMEFQTIWEGLVSA